MSYRVISDTEVAEGQPITQPLMQALKDNMEAAAAGEETAPRITEAAHRATAGNVSLGGGYRVYGNGNTPTATITKDGTYRVRLMAANNLTAVPTSTTWRADFYHEGVLIFSTPTADGAPTSQEATQDIVMAQGDEIYAALVVLSGTNTNISAGYRLGADVNTAYFSGQVMQTDITDPDPIWMSQL